MKALEYRYERKFVTEIENLSDVFRFIKFSPLRFYRPYKPRRINNLYLDTLNLQDYHSHVGGVCSRQKHRVRWYGDNITDVNSPVFEIKIKEGNVGTKERHSLKDLNCSLKDFSRNYENLLRSSDPENHLFNEFMARKPAMMNSYVREYFVSHDDKIRLTVDTDLQYLTIGIDGKLGAFPVKEPNVVIEIKYNPEDDYLAQLGSNELPFRSTAKSKYITGIESLDLV